MTPRSSVGWLILVAALAVPAFYYYTWWSRVNSDSRSQMSQKARRRLPEGEGLFAGAPAQNKLVNPIASAPAPSTATAAALAPAPTPSGAPGQPPMPGAPPPAQPGAPPAAPPAGTTAAVPPAMSPPPILIVRDPTISPYDLVRIKRREEEKRIKRDLGLQPAKKTVRKKLEPRIEATVELQGIITNPDTGNKAIVNGEMVGVGDTVGQVKVVRITSQSVIFSYKSRKFSKMISK